MPSLLRYGLFRIEGRWCVGADDNSRLDFPSFAEAVAATELLVRAHRACGGACEVVIQDRTGRLVSLTDRGPTPLEGSAEDIFAGARVSALPS
jgi:hypothetical protein